MTKETVKMAGYLEYVESPDGWSDSIRLVDEGAPGKPGCVPLVLDEAKALHGKQVLITIDLI